MTSMDARSPVAGHVAVVVGWSVGAAVTGSAIGIGVLPAAVHTSSGP